MGGLVISGRRVVDPASGTDAVGDVALLDGRIAAVGGYRLPQQAGLLVQPA